MTSTLTSPDRRAPLEVDPPADSAKAGFNHERSFKYVDLFAGCGGLSLGLKRAGGTHLLAVEKSPMAGESYFRNLISNSEEAWRTHVDATVIEQASAGLVVGPLDTLLNDSGSMRSLAASDLDLVAGGPPCQGFSLAGRRRSNDPRNLLAWQFLDFVDATNPRFVVIENVVGMHRKFHSKSAQTPFESLREALSRRGADGYKVQGVLLNAKHFGAPQSRPRMMLIGVRADLVAELDITVTEGVMSSAFADHIGEVRRSLLPPSTVAQADVRTVGHALVDLIPKTSLGEGLAVSDEYLREMADAKAWGLPPNDGQLRNHDLRKHRQSTQQLFRLLRILKDLGLTEAARKARIAGFEGTPHEELKAQIGKVSSFPIGSPDRALCIASEDELVERIEELLTLKHSQAVLEWNKPSRTVLTIPDDYIHPIMPRTFSVRELARLQGFPDSYTFFGKVTTGGLSRRVDVPQYTQVGNAVSPYVGLAIGEMIRSYVSELGESGTRRSS